MNRHINVHDVIDSARFNHFFLFVFLLLHGSLVLAGYAVGVYGVSLTSMRAELLFQDAEIGFLASTNLWGMMIGALVFGSISDRIGRKNMLLCALGMTFIFNGLIFFNSYFVVFSALRFMAGVGVGAITPLVVSLLSEYSPRQNRTFLLALLMTGIPTGQLIAAMAGLTFLTNQGWRFLYLLSFLGLGLIPLVLFFLPESMQFYLAKEQQFKMHHFLRKVSPTKNFTHHDIYQTSAENRQKMSFTELTDGYKASKMPLEVTKADSKDNVVALYPVNLLTQKYVRNTFVLCVAFFCNLYVFYGVSTWLPGLMMERGHAVLSGVTFLAVFLVGNISVAAVVGRFADTFGTKKIMSLFYLCLVLMIVFLSMDVEGVWVFIFVFLVGGSVGVAQNMTVAITPQFFPIAFRGTIIGLCSASSRVGSAIAPIVVGILMQQQMSVKAIFLTFTIPAVVGMVAILQTRH